MTGNFIELAGDTNPVVGYHRGDLAAGVVIDSAVEIYLPAPVFAELL